jgi:hypothetical protein
LRVALYTCWSGDQAGALQVLRFTKCKNRTPTLAELRWGRWPYRRGFVPLKCVCYEGMLNEREVYHGFSGVGIGLLIPLFYNKDTYEKMEEKMEGVKCYLRCFSVFFFQIYVGLRKKGTKFRQAVIIPFAYLQTFITLCYNYLQICL